MNLQVTEADLARDLVADLQYIEEKRKIPRLEYDIEDDVDLSFRAKNEDGWPAAIRRALAAEAKIIELEKRLSAANDPQTTVL